MTFVDADNNLKRKSMSEIAIEHLRDHHILTNEMDNALLARLEAAEVAILSYVDQEEFYRKVKIWRRAAGK